MATSYYMRDRTDTFTVPQSDHSTPRVLPPVQLHDGGGLWCWVQVTNSGSSTLFLGSSTSVSDTNFAVSLTAGNSLTRLNRGSGAPPWVDEQIWAVVGNSAAPGTATVRRVSGPQATDDTWPGALPTSNLSAMWSTAVVLNPSSAPTLKG